MHDRSEEQNPSLTTDFLTFLNFFPARDPCPRTLFSSEILLNSVNSV